MEFVYGIAALYVISIIIDVLKDIFGTTRTGGNP
jgi:hypothetical protein